MIQVNTNNFVNPLEPIGEIHNEGVKFVLGKLSYQNYGDYLVKLCDNNPKEGFRLLKKETISYSSEYMSALNVPSQIEQSEIIKKITYFRLIAESLNDLESNGLSTIMQTAKLDSVSQLIMFDVLESSEADNDEERWQRIGAKISSTDLSTEAKDRLLVVASISNSSRSRAYQDLLCNQIDNYKKGKKQEGTEAKSNDHPLMIRETWREACKQDIKGALTATLKSGLLSWIFAPASFVSIVFAGLAGGIGSSSLALAEPLYKFYVKGNR